MTPRPSRRAPTFVLRPERSDRPVTRQDLHAFAQELGLDRVDRLVVTVAGDTLQITLSPLGLADCVLAAEFVDAVVCVRDEGPVYVPDDVRTSCADCGGTPIRHRPRAPFQSKMVCPACGPRTGTRR